MIGVDGKLAIDSVERLGTLFRGIRFCKKPGIMFLLNLQCRPVAGFRKYPGAFWILRKIGH